MIERTGTGQSSTADPSFGPLTVKQYPDRCHSFSLHLGVHLETHQRSLTQATKPGSSNCMCMDCALLCFGIYSLCGTGFTSVNLLLGSVSCSALVSLSRSSWLDMTYLHPLLANSRNCTSNKRNRGSTSSARVSISSRILHLRHSESVHLRVMHSGLLRLRSAIWGERFNKIMICLQIWLSVRSCVHRLTLCRHTFWISGLSLEKVIHHHFLLEHTCSKATMAMPFTHVAKSALAQCQKMNAWPCYSIGVHRAGPTQTCGHMLSVVGLSSNSPMDNSHALFGTRKMS